MVGNSERGYNSVIVCSGDTEVMLDLKLKVTLHFVTGIYMV